MTIRFGSSRVPNRPGASRCGKPMCVAPLVVEHGGRRRGRHSPGTPHSRDARPGDPGAHGPDRGDGPHERTAITGTTVSAPGTAPDAAVGGARPRVPPRVPPSPPTVGG